jgi:hypothetical protein
MTGAPRSTRCTVAARLPGPESDLFYPADAYVLTGRPASRSAVTTTGSTCGTRIGAIHLTQANNTLGAEVNLAARAAIPRHGHQTPANDTSGITRCGGWGAPDRDSDPHIGSAANAFVRNGYRISLTDPVGLYISDLTATTLRLPDASVVEEGEAEIPKGVSSDLATWWRVVRPTDPGSSPQRAHPARRVRAARRRDVRARRRRRQCPSHRRPSRPCPRPWRRPRQCPRRHARCLH